MTSRPDTALNVAVSVALSPSSILVSSRAMLTEGEASSSVIVPVACESEIVALLALLKLTANVSSFSSRLSLAMVTVNVFAPVWPAVHVSVPLAAVKSVFDVAVEPAVA